MEAINTFFSSPTAHYLVMTLLHSLWQGALLAGILWCLLAGIKERPGLRYTISLMTLGVLILSCFITFSFLSQTYTTLHPQADSSPPPSSVHSSPSAQTSSAPAPNPSAPNTGFTGINFQWQKTLLLIWCAGTFLMLLRMLVSLGDVQRLRRGCCSSTSSLLQDQVDSLKQTIHISRHILIGFSTKIAAPCTIGFLRPMIILPAGFAEMVVDELETILLHELAHIKRLDWLVNLVQMFIESLLFFNPAMWWISRQIRIEREAACDACVIKHTQKPIQYAQLLVRFAQDSQPTQAVAFASRSHNSLTERVKRLIVPGYQATVHPGILPVLLTLIALGFCGMGAYKTTDATLRYFGRHLTAKEQAEVVHQLQEEYNPKNKHDVDLPKDQWIRVQGRVIPPENSVIPLRDCKNSKKTCKHLDLNLLTQTRNCTASQSIANDGSFDITMRKTMFTLTVSSPHFATQHVELQCDPGEHIKDLIILLKPGYTSNIRCIDLNGQPVPNALLKGGYPCPPFYNSYNHSVELVTNKEGIVTINHASEALLTLNCQADGFIKDQKEKIQLHPKTTLDWVLKPAPGTEIKITDADTGLPLSEAPVYVKGERFFNSFDSTHETKTDKNGYAVLSSLLPGKGYLVMIKPGQKQRQYFIITAGDPINASFEKQKPIRGRILGDLSLLKQNEHGPYLQVSNSYSYNSSGYTNSSRKVPVQIINEKEATFELIDYYGQRVTISGGNKSITVNVDEEKDLDKLILNLSPQDIDSPNQCQVKIHFTGLSQDELKTLTTFKLAYKSQGSRYTEPHPIEVVDGKAETYIPLPNSISWEPTTETPLFFKREHKSLTTEQTHTVYIDCMPAGSIYGRIAIPNNSQYQYTYIRLHFLNRDVHFKRTGFLQNDDLNLTSQPLTKFMFSPLPLEGRYCVSLKCGNTFTVSKEIYLNADQPICELSLPWPEQLGSIQGTILDTNGHPAPEVSYSLSASIASHSHGFGDQKTDEQGRFKVDNINIAPEVSYSLRVKPQDSPWFAYKVSPSDKPITLKLKKGITIKGILKGHNGHPIPNANFSVSPSTQHSKQGYEGQEIKTDSQGRFQATLADIEYSYYSRRQLTDRSSTGKFVKFRPTKSEDLIVIIDVPDHSRASH